MKTHIVEDWNTDVEVSVVVAECGAVATIGPDGVPHPEGFDFYEPPWTDKATCEACRREYEAKCAAWLRENRVDG